MRIRGDKIFVALCAAAALAAGGVTGASAGLAPTLHTGQAKGKSPELVKTLPITKRKNRSPRVVESLGPAQIGQLADGDLVRGFGEVEVSVTCMQPSPQCVGRIYTFSPKVQARLYLAGSRSSRSGMPVGDPKRITCAQDLPNRNHHCVLSLVDERRTVRDVSKLPCEPGHCHLNLVMTAYHSGARKGNVVVVGTDEDSGIHQGKASLGVAVHRPGRLSAFSGAKTRQTRALQQRRIPVGSHAGSRDERVIYSVRLADLRAGEQLVARSAAHIRISSLPYNTLVQSRLILADSPSATKSSGVPFGATNGHPAFDAANGFNCTRGKSAFPSPCPVVKSGVVRMVYDSVTQPSRGRGSKVPLYVNLVVGMSQEYGGAWHSGDRARVLHRGFLRVERYPATYKR